MNPDCAVCEGTGKVEKFAPYRVEPHLPEVYEPTGIFENCPECGEEN